MSPETKYRTRRAKLSFGGVKNLPVHILFIEHEFRFLERFKAKHPDVPRPDQLTRNWIACCATAAFKDGYGFKITAKEFYASNAKKVGINPAQVRTVGEYLEIERALFPVFIDKFEAFCKLWGNEIDALDLIILRDPEAPHQQIQDIARREKLPESLLGDQTVTKRIYNLYWACRKSEEMRLREQLATPANCISFTQVFIQGEVVANLRETDSPERLFTEAAWKKWPIAARILNGMTTLRMNYMLKEGISRDSLTMKTLSKKEYDPKNPSHLRIYLGETLRVPRLFTVTHPLNDARLTAH